MNARPILDQLADSLIQLGITANRRDKDENLEADGIGVNADGLGYVTIEWDTEHWWVQISGCGARCKGDWADTGSHVDVFLKLLAGWGRVRSVQYKYPLFDQFIEIRTPRGWELAAWVYCVPRPKKRFGLFPARKEIQILRAQSITHEDVRRIWKECAGLL